MPIQKDLIDAIDSALGGSIPLSYTTASAANDVFEGYVWSLVVAAAKDAGGIVRFKDISGSITTALIFRTSPGNIYSAAKQYTYAEIEFSGCPMLEAHIGVYVIGKSQIIHECDVAVVHRAEATVCRAQGVHPRSARVPIALECKFHAGVLQLGQARAFLGLTQELSKAGRYLVTNASSPNASKMVNHHGVEWEFEMNLKDQKIPDSLKANLQRKFRDYITENK